MLNAIEGKFAPMNKSGHMDKLNPPLAGLIYKLKEKIAALPDASGVYMSKDSRGKIIYIGKAKSLKKRVGSYFNRFPAVKTQALVSKIVDLEHLVTASESQAMILEANLVKDKQPVYNVSLKDDKSFPLIRISDGEFPVVSICRKKNIRFKDTGSYFGPYTNVRLLRSAFKMMRRIFGFRSCKNMRRKACLYYPLKLCPGPCIGKISFKDYEGIIANIRMFLESRYEELITKLSCNMKEAALRKQFEEAAEIRDQINALSVIGQNRVYPAGFNELEDLKNLLELDRLPERIEAFDISNILGKEACGSMVSFYNAVPDKVNYRRFRIKSVAQIDDYKMLAEVVRRRYSRLARERIRLCRI
ncbi:MAG: UvrB/UvrC motif-containing protein [Candidatus Omnitrophota bacterium]